MERASAVVIGAGHAGLAASHFLSDRSIDHVVLERGEVANSWRRERWDSLRLLTPNWQSRLPGHRYEGPDPDGYMTTGEVTEFIERFAKVSNSPVRTGENVTSLRRAEAGYRVTTSLGEIDCRTVVIASGACNEPAVPQFRDAVPASVEQLTPFDYRDPARRRCAGRRRVSDRRTAGGRAAAVWPARHAVGRRARAAAAYVPRPRRAVVDGRVRGVGSATR
jgi:putative flavoprotein involved in K+ transport